MSTHMSIHMSAHASMRSFYTRAHARTVSSRGNVLRCNEHVRIGAWHPCKSTRANLVTGWEELRVGIAHSCQKSYGRNKKSLWTHTGISVELDRGIWLDVHQEMDVINSAFCMGIDCGGGHEDRRTCIQMHTRTDAHKETQTEGWTNSWSVGRYACT